MRPNFVKIASLWRAIAARGRAVEPTLIATGQHHAAELADAFAAQLGLPPPNVRLGVTEASGQGQQTAAILERYERHLMRSAPRAVVVVGDVNSTLACALAAAKLGVPVAHVEAGLRSYDRSMPEEINRVLVDHMSELLLASEPSAVDALAREGIAGPRVRLVGSLTIDTLAHELPAARATDMAGRLGLAGAPFALVTLHRPSNVDSPERLGAIVDALEELASRLPIVFPLHPRTAGRLSAAGLRERLERAARVLPPQGYRETLGLMSATSIVITDSGGMQEETTQLGVPCLTLRSNTERPSTLAGTNTLVEDSSRLPELVRHRLEGPRPTPAHIDGWDGRASERAVDALLEAFG